MNKMTTGIASGLASGVTGAAITVLLYFADVFQWPHFTETVAAAFVTLSGFALGVTIHLTHKDAT